MRPKHNYQLQRRAMRPEIKRLLQLGPLPSEDDPSVEKLRLMECELRSISKPVTDDEARALMTLFGPDDCFGAAWSVLHLIESAPGWPVRDCLIGGESEWVATLRDRAFRGGMP
jgi:hypothetical protein